MLSYILGYIVIPLETICCKMFFETFCLRKRNKALYQILFWLSLCVLLYILTIFFGNSFVLKQITVIGIVAVATKIYWRITYKKSIMLAFLFQNLVLIADYVVVMIDSSLLEKNINQSQGTQAFFVLLSKMVLFLLILVIKHIFGKSQLDFLGDAVWLKFMFFPFFTICIIIALIYKPDLMIDESQKQIFWVFALGLIGMNIMFFYLLQDVANKERELCEQRIFEREAKHKFLLYESMAEATKQQQALSHEYQNHLVCIQSLLHEGEYKKLEEYVEQITGVVLKDLDYIDTNNAIVNAILNEKYFQAIKQDIVMVYKINDLTQITIEDQDISLLLSNLLNNAIEACQKCTTQKVIKVKFVLEDENIVLSVKNTYDGHVITSEDNYLTTKIDKENHGIGIKNMIKVIEKYDGFYSITHDESIFSFSFIFPR